MSDGYGRERGDREEAEFWLEGHGWKPVTVDWHRMKLWADPLGKPEEAMFLQAALVVQSARLEEEEKKGGKT